MRTMGRSSGFTDRTDPTGRVDFTDDPFSDKVRMVRGMLDDSDEFMAWYSLKAHVALDEMQIRGANARLDDTNDGFSVSRCRSRVLLTIFQTRP